LVVGTLLLASAAPPEPAVAEGRKDALARFGTAVWQARRDRLLSAARSFEAATNQDPDSTAPLKELVAVYAQLGREPDAIRVARTVLEKDPHDADTAHALSKLLFDAGELTEAVTVAKLAAENVDADEHPDKALGIYRDLATLSDKAGDPAAAAAALRQAVELLTTNRKQVIDSGVFTAKEVDDRAADTFERLGRALAKQGKADAAVEAFRSAHKLFADPARANDPGAAARLDWNLSGAYEAAGDPAEAIRHLESFLKLRPQAVEPYERLASLLNQAGSGDTVSVLQRYADRDPKNLGLLAVLASEQARDPAERARADATFTRLWAATNDPKVVRVLVRSRIATGDARLVIDEIDRAYQAIKDDASTTAEKRAFAAEKARVVFDILRAEPTWAEAVLRAAADGLTAGTSRTYQTRHLLATLAARHHKLDFAVILFRQALGAAPVQTQGEVYPELIDVLWRSRKPAEVAEVCRQALQSRGLFHGYFNFHLAYALAELGDADEAIAAADKAIAQAGGADRIVYRLRKASVLEVLGRWDDAVGLCRKLLDEFDAPADRTRIRYALSAAYWGAKKYREAEAELRGILDADPDHASACNDLGYHLAEQGRNLDEAERLVRHAVAVDHADRHRAGDPEPNGAAYLDSLAWVLFRRDKLTEARDILVKVSAMPDGASDPVVWDHLGDVRFRLGEKEQAKAAWGRAAVLLAADARGKRDGRLDEVKRKLKRVP
jgi:tetratricopeptide (TPR) repeat protein